MKNQNIKILLVEDDENLGFILKDYLELIGYNVDLQKNGNAGYTSFLSKKFDLCILDIMLPFKDGFTLAEDIRKKDESIPIIFLTAKTLKEDKIRGFKIGADDYITKPFSTEELSLRIEAIFKRIRLSIITPECEIYTIGIYNFDYYNQILSTSKGVRNLTKREADVLRMLYLNKNQLLKREIALKQIWGSDDYFMGRSMDVYIAKLRKYLSDDENINIINVHGSGFKLEIK
ncbi:MAG: two-component system response regulator [Bacteroidetes bacterium GWA2_30_7]|nr:MAG: two-component system response regulator [Bacteroidetes bacterium GWA2_30_7]